MIAVSVIIPVYNTEKYISECIESLLLQTLTNCEFIFVNDGSTDNCQQIIESYQKKDNRIVLLNQKNQGVSTARNNGIAIAKGEYIGFVDGDDFIEKDMYEKLYSQSNQQNTDVVISNFITEEKGIKTKSKPYFQTNIVFDNHFIQKNIMPFLIKEDGLNSACNKIYKRELIIESKINFPTEMTFAEDAMFNLNAFNNAQKIIFIDYSGYHYREVDNSATRNKVSENYFIKHIDLYNFDFKRSYNLTISDKDIDELKANRLIDTVVSLIHIFFKSDNKMNFIDKKKYVKMMITNKTIQTVINQYWEPIIAGKSKYNQFILKSIKSKSIFRLILATTYSNFRNRK